jgi:hypothetical protein
MWTATLKPTRPISMIEDGVLVQDLDPGLAQEE